MMKVLFVHDGYIMSKNGELYSSTYNDSIIRKYKRISDELTFCTRIMEKNETGKLIKLHEHFSFVGVPNFKNVHYLNLVEEAKRVVKQAVKESDLIVARIPSDLGIFAVYFAKKLNKKYVVEVVGCPLDSLSNHSIVGKIIAPVYYFKQKKIVHNAENVRYVTNVFLQNRYPNNRNNIGCSDVRLPSISKNEIEQILNNRIKRIETIDSKRLIVLGTIGTLDMKYKGFDTVIKAIAFMNSNTAKKYKYVIVGTGNQQWLNRIIKKYKVQESVEIIPGIDHDRIFNWLSEIDLYIQPSKTEGMPRALIEAMSQACPCFGSNVGGIPELLSPECLFHKGNVMELIKLLSNCEKSSMMKNARQNLEKSNSYSMESLDDKEKIFYQKVLSSINI